jgi:hypothetical protein
MKDDLELVLVTEEEYQKAARRMMTDKEWAAYLVWREENEKWMENYKKKWREDHA